MNAALLLLADPRLPAGGHAHSGGVEPAVAAGLVVDDASLRTFLAGRLATTGLVTAALAAAACLECSRPSPQWLTLDAEADARTPSPAQRAASRAQGRGLLRAARVAFGVQPGMDDPTPASSPTPSVWPHAATADGSAAVGPHYPVVLGACTWLAGGTPHDAATLVATAAITGPASAAVRLLGLDPLAVHAVLAGLAAQVDAVAAAATTAAEAREPAELPAASAPALDVLAEQHRRQEVRLFES
jgi:urease accessory protein